MSRCSVNGRSLGTTDLADCQVKKDWKTYSISQMGIFAVKVPSASMLVIFTRG
jgi:hypothetical protein